MLNYDLTLLGMGSSPLWRTDGIPQGRDIEGVKVRTRLVS